MVELSFVPKSIIKHLTNKSQVPFDPYLFQKCNSHRKNESNSSWVGKRSFLVSAKTS